jgi:hypothetical protein
MRRDGANWVEINSIPSDFLCPPLGFWHRQVGHRLGIGGAVQPRQDHPWPELSMLSTFSPSVSMTVRVCSDIMAGRPKEGIVDSGGDAWTKVHDSWLRV